MRAIDVLRANESFCRLMTENDIEPSDVLSIRMYDDWVRLRKEGHKYKFIMFYLTHQYGKSESGVLRIVKRMEREVKI